MMDSGSFLVDMIFVILHCHISGNSANPEISLVDPVILMKVSKVSKIRITRSSSNIAEFAEM
jgi:hypothetical protein